MNIIPASATIIEDELAKLTLPERIERCGRICYKSEDKIKLGSAEPFCEKVIKRGHDSVLEMAVQTLLVKATAEEIMSLVCMYPVVKEMSYLKMSFLPKDNVLVTGSVRTFRDLHRVTGGQSWILEQCYNRLSATHSLPLFADEGNVGDKKDFYPNCNRILLATRTDGSNAIAVSFPDENGGRLSVRGSEIADKIFSLHKHVVVKFVVNRAVSHELVRHRTCSFLQESQRYVKMDESITFIRPSAFFADDSEVTFDWKNAMQSAENGYNILEQEGASPQEARLVLPNSTKTELIVYTNLDGWGHIFDQRDSKAADPSMREVMAPLHEEFRQRWPEVFRKKQTPEEG